jgi:hypothetical protein
MWSRGGAWSTQGHVRCAPFAVVLPLVNVALLLLLLLVALDGASSRLSSCGVASRVRALVASWWSVLLALVSLFFFFFFLCA